MYLRPQLNIFPTRENYLGKRCFPLFRVGTVVVALTGETLFRHIPPGMCFFVSLHFYYGMVKYPYHITT